MKHNYKQISLLDYITGIIIEDTNGKKCIGARVKTLFVKTNNLKEVQLKI